MRKRSLERAWTAALALIASIAIAMALYVQSVERKSRQEAGRISADRNLLLVALVPLLLHLLTSFWPRGDGRRDEEL